MTTATASAGEFTGLRAGATILRLTLGAMWVSHAWFKISAFGVDGFAGWLDSLGLPGFMAGPVIALELIGGILILAGLYARQVSILLLPVLAVALVFSCERNSGGKSRNVEMTTLEIAV